MNLETPRRGLMMTGALAVSLTVTASVFAQGSPGQAPGKPAEAAEIRYKGVAFEPGGFIEAAMLYRSANENADIGSTFANIPFQGSANSYLSEFRGTARQSRL